MMRHIWSVSCRRVESEKLFLTLIHVVNQDSEYEEYSIFVHRQLYLHLWRYMSRSLCVNLWKFFFVKLYKPCNFKEFQSAGQTNQSRILIVFAQCHGPPLAFCQLCWNSLLDLNFYHILSSEDKAMCLQKFPSVFSGKGQLFPDHLNLLILRY